MKHCTYVQYLTLIPLKCWFNFF